MATDAVQSWDDFIADVSDAEPESEAEAFGTVVADEPPVVAAAAVPLDPDAAIVASINAGASVRFTFGESNSIIFN